MDGPVGCIEVLIGFTIGNNHKRTPGESICTVCGGRHDWVAIEDDQAAIRGV